MQNTFNQKPSFGQLPAILTEREAAVWSGYSVAYFQRARWDGKGPRFIKLGRNIRYREEDLLAWISKENSDDA
jgi:predicted DNA-binding transcriptional regulator AlpA